jgi:hypothetical protein
MKTSLMYRNYAVDSAPNTKGLRYLHKDMHYDELKDIRSTSNQWQDAPLT